MGQHQCNEPLMPGPMIRDTVNTVTSALSGIEHWLGFGGLFGIVKNFGIIPDADFDFCVFYKANWEDIVRKMELRGYRCSRVLLNDIDRKYALYAGFNRPGYPHVCLSFWYHSHDAYWYCHDQKHEVSGVGVPSGYWFKGIPDSMIGPGMFFMAEWPGISQTFKVNVPIFAGSILDHCYPCWAYNKQRFNISGSKTVDLSKMGAVRAGHAVSPLMVQVDSMKRWKDDRYISLEMEKGRKLWESEVRRIKIA